MVLDSESGQAELICEQSTMLYALITLAIGIALALRFHFGSDQSVIRARHSYRRGIAAKVLSLASSLEDKQL